MPEISRRDALRYGAATVAVATAVGGAQALSGSGSPARATPAHRDPRDFTVTYRGREITGVHAGSGDRSALRAGATGAAHEVHIDGRRLAVMAIALPGGTGYISALNHYEPVLIDTGGNQDGLLRLARRAVDVLGDRELTALAGATHDHGR
ncbi:tyrosinase family oxidase copper chaperone [Actinoplanes utahensis]|uniref:tyrosinase family oxidase copper chaperone n=1 Tax=Actinoplanes utahensis TaxID=1869 RepID=UPI00068D4D80|nr:tyrosinase family oxidase copper chaperone [Actinoplanes utahensis]